GPFQNLPDGEGRQVGAVSHPAVLGEDLRQGRAAGQPSLASVQGGLDGAPGLAVRARNTLPRRRVVMGPFARSLVVIVGPAEDLLDGQVGEGFSVASSAAGGEQTRER